MNVSELGGEKRVSRYMPLSDRLLAQVRISDTGCWEWQGKKNQYGYGKAKDNGKEQRAHRLMFFLVNEHADRSLQVLHRCDNPPCINPNHLFLGTAKDNMLDMHAKGRFRGGAKAGNKNAVGNQGWRRGGIVKMLGRVK